MSSKAAIGAKGEHIAAIYLEKKGYKIIERNYRFKLAEIDLIASIENFIVFVEVKARSSNKFGHPEEAVNAKKARKVIEGAEHYLEAINWKGNIRFDIIAVKLGQEIDIQHFEDAFY